MRALLFSLTAALVVACSIDERHVEDVIVMLPQASEFVTCTSPFVKPDLDVLTKCGGDERGAGHCYDGSKVPIVESEMMPCEGGGSCVPDTVLRAGGKKAKSCTFSFNGQPGACVSLLLEGVYENREFFQTDGCRDDERCLPCVDPRDGKDTTLCGETGAHESACTGGQREPPTLCCAWAGECIEKDSVPPEIRSTMVKDTCPGAKLCAPISQVEAQPVICDVLGARGVCMDRCFLGPMSNGLVRSSCGPTERCMPCALADTFGGDQKLVGCN